MTFRGHVKNGKVILDQPAVLPDGTEVDVQPVKQPRAKTPRGGKARKPKNHDALRDLLLSYAGKLKGLPADLALNHDHYAHGKPKA